MEGVPEFNQFIDLDYELSEQALTEWVGDGHFVSRTWLWKDGELAEEVQFETEPEKGNRPCILHTCLRYDQGPRMGQSYAHDVHPFVAFLHLLRDAEIGSSVYISIPFLTDFMVIDELCHYSNPQYRGLQIYILLGPNSSCIAALQDFVGHYEDRRVSVSRLHIKQYGFDEERMGSRAMYRYAHTKAMVSTVGAMVGSYNYTYASRFRHYEHAVYLPRSNPDWEGLQAELRWRWDGAGDEAVIGKKATPQKRAQDGDFKNPYSKRPSHSK